jgi:hypothetical protein
MAQFTDEQLERMMQLDFGTQEAQLSQQQALVNQLRQQALQPSAGKDRGSQITRGLQGVLGAVGMNQQNKAMKDFGQVKRQQIGDIFRQPSTNPYAMFDEREFM